MDTGAPWIPTDFSFQLCNSLLKKANNDDSPRPHLNADPLSSRVALVFNAFPTKFPTLPNYLHFSWQLNDLLSREKNHDAQKTNFDASIYRRMWSLLSSYATK
jgi:hypothetical protein